MQLDTAPPNPPSPAVPAGANAAPDASGAAPAAAPPAAPAAAPPAVETLTPPPAGQDLKARLDAAKKAQDEAKARDEAERQQLQARIAELEGKVASEQASARKVALDAALDKARVLPKYLDIARAKLGDIDATTDAGKKAVDDFAAAHQELRAQAAAPANPMSAWIEDAKAKAAKSGQPTLMSVMPRAFIEASLDKAVS